MNLPLILLALAWLPPAAPSQARPPAEIVRSFVAAFNQQSVDGMLALAADDIEWLSVDGTNISVATAGKDALRASMTKYFAGCPTCRSAIEIGATTAVRVSAVETASWTTAQGRRSQRGLSVYEVVDGKIRRVYYFPVER